MICKINIFAIVAILSFAPYTIQQINDATFMANYHQYNIDCAQQYNFTDEYVEVTVNNMKQLPDDHNLKCFFLCINMKLGVMDESGNINDEALKHVTNEFFNVTVTNLVGTQCDVPKDGDPCQTAFDNLQCIISIQNQESG